MQVVIGSMSEEEAHAVQQELLKFCPDLSFSPVREQPSLNNAIEFYATGTCTQEEKEKMLSTLDNDFDCDEENHLYYAYSFNTKMWDPRVYYLQLEF